MIFVIHDHHARQHHFDLRLEKDGVLKSWAIPKAKIPDATTKLLAVAAEDHELSYGTFEGEIEEGSYGAGTVSIYDTGSYTIEEWKDNKVVYIAQGKKVRGRFVLLRFLRAGPKNRLWMKTKDYALLLSLWILKLRNAGPNDAHILFFIPDEFQAKREIWILEHLVNPFRKIILHVIGIHMIEK